MGAVFIRITLMAAGATIVIIILKVTTGIVTDLFPASALARAVVTVTKKGAMISTGSTVSGVEHQIRTICLATGEPYCTTGWITSVRSVVPDCRVPPDTAPGTRHGKDNQTGNNQEGFHFLSKIKYFSDNKYQVRTFTDISTEYQEGGNSSVSDDSSQE
jgi:hypothetical protein